jgi:hypothetical protein
MKLMDIELARIRPDLDINEYEPALEKAAELGATDLLGSVWTRDKAYYTEQVGRVAEMAKKYGIKYNVEFLPWAGVRNLQEAITLVDKVNADQPMFKKIKKVIVKKNEFVHNTSKKLIRFAEENKRP